MPKYVLPALPPSNETKGAEVVDTPQNAPNGPDLWARTIRIPVNKAITDAMTVGAKVSVELMGEVKSIDSSKSMDGGDRSYIEVIISEVEAYDAAQEAEEDAMEETYQRKHRR